MNKSRTKSSAPPLIKNKRGRNKSFSICNFFPKNRKGFQSAIFLPKNRKGQFYLIAAIAIIAIAIGFVVTTNYSSSTQNPGIYTLKDEISLESAKTIDFGIYNKYDFSQMQNLLTDFSGKYINESKEDNSYFIFGNNTNMSLMAYQATYSNVTLNGVDYTNSVGTGNIYLQSFQANGNNVTISLNGINYLFMINSGVNYDFIISNNFGGQNYTVTSNGNY